MAHIQLKNITKKFGAHTALRGLDLEIQDGEFFVLLGQTGAGKTTTLRLIAGLETPTDGKIFIDGVDVGDWGAAERDVALVLQQYSLYPRYTVRENLEFPLKSKIRRVDQKEIAERVDRVAKTLRIEHLLDRKTDKLSGGEMQRVSIGRAIVRKPRVFLMDEPLSALDAKLREALRTELKNLQMNLGATFLFVTHDQIEAMSMGDKIGVLNNGRLVQTGAPNEIYNNPLNTFVARSVGSPPMNLIDGMLSGGRAIMAPKSFELPYEGSSNAGTPTDGRPLVFGIRPEDIHLESGAPVEAQVHDVENHGVEKILTLRVGDSMLRATVSAKTDIAIEQSVRLAWNPKKVVLFDRASGVSLRHAS
ncbi:MAG: ABC transporter ATP-binding protein [Pseudaminobacter sp.]|nr:ABC transporter ATP-binding protein [Pseudaminobacter sp.]